MLKKQQTSALVQRRGQLLGNSFARGIYRRFELRQALQHSLSASQNRSSAGGEISAGDAIECGSNDYLGISQLQCVDALAHDGEGLHQNLQRIACRVGLRGARYVHRNYQISAHLPGVANRHGGNQATVHVVPPRDSYGLKNGRYSARCPNGCGRIAALKQDAKAAVEIRRNDAQWQSHVFDQSAADSSLNVTRQGLAPEHAAAEDGECPVCESGLVHGLGQLLQLGGRLAAGVQGRNETTRRCARYESGPDSRLFQHLDDANVGKPPGRTPT